MTRFGTIGSAIGLALLPAAVLLALSFALFPSAGRDDAYITFWAAHALSEFGEIVNLNGDRIEQSSSLLHVLVLAAASKLSPFSVPDVGYALSVVAAVLTLLYVQRLTLLFGDWKLALASSAIAATFPPFVYWTTGAMEASAAALATAALLYHAIKYLESDDLRRAPPAVWASVLAFSLVRPESVLLIGSTVVVAYVVFFIRGRSTSSDDPDHRMAVRIKTAQIGLVVFVCTVAVFGFRFLYFDALFPQPVAAKLGGLTLDRIGNGLEYLLGALLPPPVSLLPFFAAAGVYFTVRKLWKDEKPYAGGLLVVLLLLAHLGFLVVSGGDWMEGARFAVPFIPLMALLGVLALPLMRRRELLVYAVVGLLSFQMIGSVWLAKFGSVSMPVWTVSEAGNDLPVSRYTWPARANRTNLRDIPVAEKLSSIVGALMNETPGRVAIMSGQAGFVAYHVARDHFRDIRFVDRRGLTTDDFTACAGTRDVARSSTGMLFTYRAYFANRDAIEAECGVPRPDVIFELDLPELLVESVVADNGYTVVYRQTGRIVNGPPLQGIEVLANEFIAVRNGLVALIDGQLPEVREWTPR